MALATLGLAIGANTIVFSLIDTLAFRRLPVRGADRLIHVFQTRVNRAERFPLSMLDFQYYREHAHTLDSVAAHYPGSPINFATTGESFEVTGSVVTANYFDVLRLRPQRGRFFRPEEDQVPGRDPVVVLSDAFWRRQFDADSQILGRSVRLNGTDFTIVGVAPRGFDGVFIGGLAVDAWMPTSMFAIGYRYCNALTERDCRIVELLARVKDGDTIENARNELTALANQLEFAYPDTNKNTGVLVLPARGMNIAWRGDEGRTPLLLACAVAVLLAIACANVAGLLLARSFTRRREITIRLAMGAGRVRLVRQFMTETLLLALLGGAAGLVVCAWARDLVLAFYAVTGDGRRASFALELDPLAIAFTFGVSLAAAVACGILPALQASGRDVMAALKDEAIGAGPRSRTRDVLVIAQLALSMMLLVGAGLLARSVAAIYRGTDFDPHPIVVLRLRPSLVAQSAARAKAFQAEVIRRLEALPGVVAASPAQLPTVRGWGWGGPVWLPGEEPADPRRALQVSGNTVGPNYFKTLGVPFVEGRDFDAQDRLDTPPVTILDETLARLLWRHTSAVGRVLVMNGRQYGVIGVVRAARPDSAAGPVRSFAYLDFWQTPTIDRAPIDARVHVRVSGDPRAMMPLIRRTILDLDPTMPISEARPLVEWLDYAYMPVRAASVMLTSFSTLALFLSAIGVYGVVAAAVSSRTREIAIRLALGADRSVIARLVIGRAAALAAIGAGVGLVAAVASASVVASLLYGVDAHDRITLIVTPLVLIAVALLAGYLPARRAMRVDPMSALRYE